MVNSRKGNRKMRLLSRLWSPFSHTLKAGTESFGAVADTAKGVVVVGARGVNRVGKSVTGHFNGAVRDMVKSRKNRKSSRKSGGRRSSRKSTRRNRK